MLPSENDRDKTRTQNGLLEAYADMSKQYLKLITVWCVNLLLMNCFYIAFSLYKIDDVSSINELSNSRKASCIAIGVLLHYFLLCSFLFSLTISIVQYIILCRSFKVYKHILIKAIVFSISLPLVPVIIILAYNNMAYINVNK